jgi:hypothetical protein
MTVASTPHLRRPGLVITIVSLAVIAYATLLPEPGLPLDAHFCLICGSLGGVDAILNVLLFVPLGVGLALCGVGAKRTLLIVSVASVLIETAQLFIIPGRDATIGDVLTNTLGGALGFATCRYAWIWVRPSPRVAGILIVAWATIWLVMQMTTGFAFAPSIPESQYYGQLARSLGKNFAVFHGRVLAASVDDIAIPNTALADSHGVRQRLLDGATVAAMVIPAEPTPGIAPIVRVADADQKQIVLLGQNGADLLFSIHSGAEVLRLRPPILVLPRVFPIGVPNDRVQAAVIVGLGGRYLSQEVRMNAQTSSATHGSRIPLTVSLGWTLILPSQWFIEGTRAEVVISLIWIVALMVPLGYWTFRLVHSFGERGVGVQSVPTLFWVARLAILGAGLGLTPHVFGLSATPVREWLGGVGGLVLGARLAARLVTNAKPLVDTLELDRE